MATRMDATASVRRVLPRAFARSCLGSSPCIGGYHGFRMPAATECLIEAYDGLDVSKSRLNQRVLGGVKRLLCLQHGDQVDGAFAQSLFRNVKGALRAVHDLNLKSFPLRGLANIVERVLDIGKARKHSLAINLQQFVLLAFLQIEVPEQRAAVEDRLGKTRRGRVDQRLGAQQQFQ